MAAISFTRLDDVRVKAARVAAEAKMGSGSNPGGAQSLKVRRALGRCRLAG